MAHTVPMVGMVAPRSTKAIHCAVVLLHLRIVDELVDIIGDLGLCQV